MNQIVKHACLILIFCFPNLAYSATTVVDTFDADIGTWSQNTTDTTVGHSAAGGNPDGYMTTDNLAANTGIIGATNTGADYSGVFADGLWNISVDLSFVSEGFTDAWLRYRFQDSTANGWHISLGEDIFDSTWETYSVTFDTTWTNAMAVGNGWVKESDGALATPSFMALWDDVYTSEVRLFGILPSPSLTSSSLTSTGGIEAGIDNYIVSAVPIPAAVWLFATALIGLVGFSKRSKGV